MPEYEQNLVNLIKDVRKEFKAPNLPVVIGELTGPWVDAPGEWATLRKAQAAAAARPEFKGNVLFVPTRDFVRPAKESPNPSHGHHEFGNAETYFLVGDALGKGMVKLLAAEPAEGREAGGSAQEAVQGGRARGLRHHARAGRREEAGAVGVVRADVPEPARGAGALDVREVPRGRDRDRGRGRRRVVRQPEGPGGLLGALQGTRHQPELRERSRCCWRAAAAG